MEDLKGKYNRTFNTDDGRAVLKDLIEYSQMLQPVGMGEKRADLIMLYEGRREMVTFIMERMRYSAEDFLGLVEERE